MSKVEKITAEISLPEMVQRYPATRAVLERETSAVDGNGDGRFQITPQTKVADVLAHYPQSLQIFLRHGFRPLSNPVLRRTMARVVTIEQACRREGVNLAELLTELRQIAISNQRPTSDVVVPITWMVTHG